MDILRNKCTEIDKNIYRIFGICLIMALVSFLPFIIMDKGYFTLCDDYNTQMIPFATALNNSLKARNGSWEWNIGLGAQRLGGYSYYYLGSIFFYISMLFPGEMFPYIVGPLYILKYAVAGTLAYVYLKKYVSNRTWAIIGSLLYAFSGFQSINLEFYMFHDVVALFPLLLMGIEDLYEKDKKNLFIFAVAINCALNYFFFFGEVLFLVIYVLFRYLRAQGKDGFIKQSLKCILCGITGMSIASIIFIPSAIYTFGNPRILPDIAKMLKKGINIPMVLKGMIIPAEAMNNYSIIAEHNWRSECSYLPLVGLALAIAYVIKHKKDWLSKLLVFCFLISFFPVCNSAFYIFTDEYFRWWYMFIMILIIASIKVLDDRDNYDISKVSIAYGIITLGFVSMYWIGHFAGIEKFHIYRPKIFMLLSAIVFVAVFFSIVLSYQKKQVEFKYFAAIAIMCVATTSVAILLYRKTTHEPDYQSYFNAGLSLEANEDQYRYACGDNLLMYPGKANGTGAFSSTVSNSIRDFEDLFGFFNISTNMDSMDYPGVTELLAGKYEVTRDEECYASYSIVERETCPIGYYYDTYITKDELLELPVEERGYAFLRDIVIDSKYVNILSSVAVHDNAYLTSSDKTISEYVSVNTERKVTEFKKIHDGFSCVSNTDSAKPYFFSVPYDYGWTLYVDGEKNKIINASGFICTVISEGEHTLVFQYRSPGLILGILMSILGAVWWIMWNIIEKERRE